MKVSSISNPIQNNYVTPKNIHNTNQNNNYDSNKLISSNNNSSSNSVNFGGLAGIKIGLEKVYTKLGFVYDKLSPLAEKVANTGSKFWKKRIDSGNFLLDIATLSSVTTSSLYAYKYATNKDKSKNERVALALNCMLVCALGAVLTYGAKGLFKTAQKNSAKNFFEREVTNNEKLKPSYDKLVQRADEIIAASKEASKKNPEERAILASAKDYVMDALSGAKPENNKLVNELEKLVEEKDSLKQLQEIAPAVQGFSPLADLFSWALINRLAVPVVIQKPATNIAMKICHKFDDNSKAGNENNTKIAQQNNDNKSLTAQENTAKA